MKLGWSLIIISIPLIYISYMFLVGCLSMGVDMLALAALPYPVAAIICLIFGIRRVRNMTRRKAR